MGAQNVNDLIPALANQIIIKSQFETYNDIIDVNEFILQNKEVIPEGCMIDRKYLVTKAIEMANVEGVEPDYRNYNFIKVA